MAVLLSNGDASVYEVARGSHKVLRLAFAGLQWFTVVSTLSFVCAQVKGTWPGIAVCLAGDFASLGYRQILMLPDEG